MSFPCFATSKNNVFSCFATSAAESAKFVSVTPVPAASAEFPAVSAATANFSAFPDGAAFAVELDQTCGSRLQPTAREAFVKFLRLFPDPSNIEHKIFRAIGFNQPASYRQGRGAGQAEAQTRLKSVSSSSSSSTSSSSATRARLRSAQRTARMDIS